VILAEYAQCYAGCVVAAGWQYPILLLAGVIITLSVAFAVTRRPIHLFSAQGSFGAFLLVNILVMDCPMFGLIWVYLVLLLGGIVVLSVVRYAVSRHESRTVEPPRYVKELASDAGVQVSVVDSQAVKVFASKRKVFISVGALERLGPSEVRAVFAHEAYHLANTPSTALSSVLAVFSLSFVRFHDEDAADEHAASVAGADPLRSALEKLEMGGNRLARY